MNQPNSRQILDALRARANPEKAPLYQRFFKTGPGQYGEGDVFLGLTVPLVREVAKQYRNTSIAELDALVARLDAGQLPLDELLTQYQRGAQLLAYCREKLDAVEQQIQVMDGGELKNWTAGA